MLSLAATRNRLVQLMGPTMRGMPSSLRVSKVSTLSVPARGYSNDGLKKLDDNDENNKKAKEEEEEDDFADIPEALIEDFKFFSKKGILPSELDPDYVNVPQMRQMAKDFDPDLHLDADFRIARKSKFTGLPKSFIEAQYYGQEHVTKELILSEIEKETKRAKNEANDEENSLDQDQDQEEDGEYDEEVEDFIRETKPQKHRSPEDAYIDQLIKDQELRKSGFPAFKKALPIIEEALSTSDPTKSAPEKAAKDKKADRGDEEEEEDQQEEEEEEEENDEEDSLPLDVFEKAFLMQKEAGRGTILPETFYRKSLVQADEQKVLDAAFMFQSLDTLDAVTENYETKVKQQKAAKRVDAGKHFAETLKQRNQFDAQKIFLPELSAEELAKRKQLVEQFVQETAKTSKNVSAAELDAFKQDLSNKILQAGADPVAILNSAKQQHSEKPFALECISALLTNKDKLREIFEASALRPRDLDFETYAASVKAKLEPSLRQMIFGFEANEDPSNPPVSGSVKGLTIADSFNTRRLFEALNPNMISLLQHYEAYPKQVKSWVKLFFTPRGVWNEEGRWEPVSGYRSLLTEDSRNLIDHISPAASTGLKNHKEATTQTTEKVAAVQNDGSYQSFDESFDIFGGNQDESRKSKTTLPKPKPIPADLIGQYRFGFTAEEVAPLPEKMQKLLTFAYATPREIKKHRIQVAREKWEQGPKDTGSSAAQVAMMTERLNAIAEHIRMFPRDLVAKRQNILLANKRKNILKYLKRENITLYYSIIDSLGLRDVQALKPRNRNK